MTPKTQTIIPPEGGWKPHTYYKVEASFGPSNPIHGYLFYSGFLNGPNKTPGGYNQFCCDDENTTISSVSYLRVIEAITTEAHVERVPNKGKLPGDIK